MIAKITTATGESFYLAWKEGKVLSDSPSPAAEICLDYLNGAPTIYLGEPHHGCTDGHYEEERPLRSNMEFLLIVGGLADRFEVRVELVGELSDGDHEEVLNNPAADAAISKMAIRRAIESGMSHEEAIALYGSDSGGKD